MTNSPTSPEPVRDELDQEGLEAAAKALCRVSSKGRCSESCPCNNADEYGFVPDARAAILAYKEWEREQQRQISENGLATAIEHGFTEAQYRAAKRIEAMIFGHYEWQNQGDRAACMVVQIMNALRDAEPRKDQEQHCPYCGGPMILESETFPVIPLPKAPDHA